MMDIVQSIKDVWNCAKKLEQHELLEKLADLKDVCYELRDENRELREKIAEKESHHFVFENNMYWDQNLDGTRDGPYCTSCWDNCGKAIRMHKSRTNELYNCPICKVYIEGVGYVDPALGSGGFDFGII